MQKPSVTVIMPALNEAENIEAAIRGSVGALSESEIDDFEILVMTCLDARGQHDGTVDIVRKIENEDTRIKAIHTEGYQDLGEKYRLAVSLASKEHVVMIPGDNENDESSFPEIFKNIGNADMVISYTSNPETRSMYRRVLSRTYTLGLTVLFWHGLPYYNGINVYRPEDLRRALPQTKSFAYSAEILINLLRQNKKYVAVPIRIRPRIGASNAISLRSFKNVISAIARLRIRMKRNG